MKKIIALFIACLIVVSIAACGANGGVVDGGTGGDAAGGGETGGNVAGGADRDTIRMAIGMDLGTLSPAHISGDFFTVVLNIQEPLWYQNRENETTFRLATSVDVIDDLTWIIHLRDDVYFSNGEKFTASDVLFSIRIHDEAGVSGQGRIQDIDMENSRVIDDYTLELHWTQYRWEQWMILSDMLIYHEASFTMEGASSSPIGTGPFAVTEYVVNSHIFLERRDDYWGELPAFRYLEFRVIAEPSQVVNALQTDNIDIGRVVPHDYEFVSGLDRVNVRNRHQATWAHLGFNVVPGYSIFNDIYARHAVAHSINRQVFVDVVFLGLAEVMPGPVSRICFDWEPIFDELHDIYTVPYDIERARRYAERSGLMGQEVRLITDGTPEFVQIAEIIQNMLTQIDVTANIQNFDPAGFTTASRDKEMFDLAIGRGFAPTLFYAGSLANFVRFNVLYNQPSFWDGSERYLEIAPMVFFYPDPEVRREIGIEMAFIYAEAALWYSLVEFLVSEAFDVDIQGPFVYTLSGFLLTRYLTFG